MQRLQRSDWEEIPRHTKQLLFGARKESRVVPDYDISANGAVT